NPGLLRISSLNNSLESDSFALPTNSLTVNLLGGDDTLQINSFESTSGASLTLNGGTGTDAVTVAPNAVISTRNTGGGDPLSAPSTGNSGAASIAAETISIETGAQVRADADSGFTGGAITLNAIAIGDGSSDANASVLIDGATVRGASLSMTAGAAEVANANQPTLSLLSFNSTASSVVQGNADIEVTGAFTMRAVSLVAASATATAQPINLINTDAAIAGADIAS